MLTRGSFAGLAVLILLSMVGSFVPSLKLCNTL